jgi:hypothetical protein
MSHSILSRFSQQRQAAWRPLFRALVARRVNVVRASTDVFYATGSADFKKDPPYEMLCAVLEAIQCRHTAHWPAAQSAMVARSQHNRGETGL